MRLDQWLWAVRLYKTRSLAVEAIKGGHVKLNGAATKPAHEAKPGDLVTARVGVVTRTLRVLDAPRSRVAAKLVALYAENLTPPEEFEKQRAVEFRPLAARPRGSGRPTKRERRLMEGWAGEEAAS
ncbi:MAG: RNA-binding S4 domain-containing protein [Verrucomicrobiota bacterium]